MNTTCSDLTAERRTYTLQDAIPAVFIVVWSSGYLASKVALAHAAPFTVLVLRFAIAALVFAALATVARATWPPARALAHSAVTGLLTLALQFGALYTGMALGASAGIAALVIGAMPIGVSLIATLTGESLTRRQWLGLALGFGGVLLVVADRIDPNALTPAAFIALLVALVGISAGTVYQKRYATSIDLRIGLGVQHAVAALVLLPFAAYEGFHHDGSTAFALSLGWLVVGNSLGGFGLLFLLIRRGAATSVAALFYLVPATTAAMSWLLLGEALTALKFAGFALAAGGVFLATRK